MDIATAQAEKLLPSASLTLSINGVDYVTNKNIVSLETGWKNNIQTDSASFQAPPSRQRAMAPRARSAAGSSSATAKAA